MRSQKLFSAVMFFFCLWGLAFAYENFSHKNIRSYVEKHPELFLLATDQVQKTEENSSSQSSGPSEKLFWEKFMEFDRSILALYCLNLILDGSDASYRAFTKGQKPELRLSYSSFKELQDFAVSLFENDLGLSQDEVWQTLETGLILGDIGKSYKARKQFASLGISAPDHDDFHHEFMKELLKKPELAPSFAALPKVAQQLLVESDHGTHFGHITHLEGKEQMFSPLVQTQIVSRNPYGFKLDYLIHLCDVCGALGHVNPECSLVYTENTHQAISKVLEACLVLQHPDRTEKDAYDVYVSYRAKWLGLDPKNSLDRVLTRVGCMLRLFSPEDGKILREAVSGLSKQDKTRISFELDQKSTNRPTPTYVPAVLVNLMNNPTLGEDRDTRLKAAVELGLPFVAKVLSEKGEVPFKGPLNFNPVAATAKSNPFALADLDYLVDEDGMVIVSLH